MMNCLFCQIINKEKSADILYEDKKFVVFKDINPKAPLHLLIVSKKHIPSINHLKTEDKKLIGELFLTVKKITKKQKVTEKGYKLVFNVGRGGGQLIDHLHLHLLSGKPVQLP